MANANQGLKLAARIGWEQKLLRLCGADKYEIVNIPVEGIKDTNGKVWRMDQFDEVLKSNGFECVAISQVESKKGSKIYRKEKVDERESHAGRTFGKSGRGPKGVITRTQRITGAFGEARKTHPVSNSG